METMEIFVARQPVFTKSKRLFGYELLFRDSMENFMPDIDGDLATSKLLSNSFFSMGLDSITGGKKAFINYTEKLLLKKLPLLFPSETMVVEVLEDVQPTKEVINVCKMISELGYQIALDDFLYSPELQPLMEIADIVKIDIRQIPIEKMEAYLKHFEKFNFALLAEKVETIEEFERSKDLGFEYFQGYFFQKPEIIRGKDIPSSQLAMLQILSAVNRSEMDFKEIEKMVAHDIGISYKLLRYINSAFFRRTQKISSIRQALVYLGEKEIRRFVAMITVSNLATGKPDELVSTSCIRAKFCELIGKRAKTREEASELFTLGLFSLIDAILDQDMKDIMERLPLSHSITEALVERKGEMNKYLLLVENYEKGKWKAVSDIARSIGDIEKLLPSLYFEACEWSNSFTSF